MTYANIATPSNHSAPHATATVAFLPRKRASRSAESQQANEAMLRYAQGDATAFADLYPLLAPRLYRHCLALSGQNDAEELLQEVFLKIHRARASFVDSGGVFAWASTIARTTHLDLVRYRKCRPETSTEHDHLDRHAANDADRPDDISTRNALQTEVERELNLLSDNLRSAYVLVKLDGLSCAAAGAELGVSIAAVKQRVCRATSILKTNLAEVLEVA